jgi:uncharacterized protein
MAFACERSFEMGSMNIKQRIESDLKIALLAGDKDRVSTLRGLKSVILNAEIANNLRQEGLPDDQLIQLLNKEAKKRIESAEMYTQGGSAERADRELKEKDLITIYLPAQLTGEEIEMLVDEVISEVKPNGMQDMGKVIALVKDRAAGQADGSRVAALVKERIKEA